MSRLTLRKDTLTALTPEELGSVVGADATTLTGVYPTLPYRACLSEALNCTG
jgi:hypothetical protein